MQPIGDQDWHVQLKQTGVKLEQGKTYKISFKAKASIDRDIKFAFQRNGLVRKTADGAEDWTVYFEDGQIPVTKEWKTYSAVFQMKEATDTDTSMSFSLGAVGGKRITDKHTVMIDDVMLVPATKDEEEKVKTGSTSGGSAGGWFGGGGGNGGGGGESIAKPNQVADAMQPDKWDDADPNVSVSTNAGNLEINNTSGDEKTVKSTTEVNTTGISKLKGSVTLSGSGSVLIGGI